MVVKIYVSGISGNKEVKKRQQRVLMILDSRNVKYEILDIAEPGNEEHKDFMQNNSTSLGATVGDANPRHPLPPQVFNDEAYCGDYDQFDMANEIDEIEKFLKLAPDDSTPTVTSNAEVKLENGTTNDKTVENGTEEKDDVKEDDTETKEDEKEAKTEDVKAEETKEDKINTNDEEVTKSNEDESKSKDVKNTEDDVKSDKDDIENKENEVESKEGEVESKEDEVASKEDEDEEEEVESKEGEGKDVDEDEKGKKEHEVDASGDNKSEKRESTPEDS